jgi:hypothetical protein
MMAECLRVAEEQNVNLHSNTDNKQFLTKAAKSQFYNFNSEYDTQTKLKCKIRQRLQCLVWVVLAAISADI